MAIVIILVILVCVLGTGWKVFRFLNLTALLKKRSDNHTETTKTKKETVPNIPEIPELSDEELRKKLSALRIWMWVKKGTPLFGVVVFVTIAISVMRQESFSGMEIVYEVIVPPALVSAVMFGMLMLAYTRVEKLKVLLGAAVTFPILKEIFDVKVYRSNGHLPSELISSAGLVDDWNRIEGSDYIEGSYKGINILYSDLHLQRREESRDSDGTKTVSNITVFRGQWLVCDFGKELATSIRLIERMGGTKWQRTIDAAKSDIETENIEFNKKYRIITEDGHTAFYLLTPHFMERLVAADEAANASTRFCFQDGKVHIGLYSGRDSFELKGVKLCDMESVRQKFCGDLKYMTDILDELLLNENLFNGSMIHEKRGGQ